MFKIFIHVINKLNINSVNFELTLFQPCKGAENIEINRKRVLSPFSRELCV